jgi:hypothetical protein
MLNDMSSFYSNDINNAPTGMSSHAKWHFIQCDINNLPNINVIPCQMTCNHFIQMTLTMSTTEMSFHGHIRVELMPGLSKSAVLHSRTSAMDNVNPLPKHDYVFGYKNYRNCKCIDKRVRLLCVDGYMCLSMCVMCGILLRICLKCMCVVSSP